MLHCNTENEKIGNIFRNRGAVVLFHVNAPLEKSVNHFDFYSKKYFLSGTQYSKCYKEDFVCVSISNNGENVIGNI